MISPRLARATLALTALCVAASSQSQNLLNERSSSQPALVATLRPKLIWQRTSPPSGQMEGPMLYQLLFSTAGTPGTLAKFDTNPRHLTNSLISDNGSMVAIGGMSVNGGTGVITFASGQTFNGNGAGLTNVNAAQLNGLGSGAFAPASGSPSYVAKSGDTMTGGLQLAPAGTGGTQVLSSPPLDLTDSQPCSFGNRCSSRLLKN